MTENLLALSPAAVGFQALSGLAVGGLLGLFHFGALWWNVGYLANGSVLRALVVQLLRFAVLAGALYGVAQLGALVLLSAAIGILVARSLILRRVKGMS